MITRHDFGMTPDGQPVELYRLTNTQGLVADVMSYGATLVGLHMPDRDGRMLDVIVGFETLDPFTQAHPYFGALVGRYCNRIAEGRFSLDGKQYQLNCNNGRHHLHGGPEGFHRKVWRTAIHESADGPAVALTLHSPDGDEGFPGALEVEVLYTLSNTNELRLEYTATTDSATVLNLTNHAYFNLSGEDTILGHQLQLNASHFIPTNAEAIPLGNIAPVANTPMDFRELTRIGLHIEDQHEQILAGQGYDHCWVIDKQPGELALAARLLHADSGRMIEVLTTQPGVQFYTGNFLDESLIGKNGKTIGYRAGLCLETQHFPDSPNQPSFPATVLRAGDVFRQTSVFRMLSVEC